MANLVPTVTPPNNALGIQVGFTPTVIFDQAIDTGSISASSCFLVEITKQDAENLDGYLANSSMDIVLARVTSQRINLADEDEYAALDHGADVDSGEQYRTKIYIKPNNLLKPNTNYAGLVSKDISLLTVFDPEPNGGNTGTGALTAQGVYEGLTTDTYTVTVMSAGDKNTAEYVWSRTSDGKTSVMIGARGRLVEIDRGLEIEFQDGSYELGDSFTIRVRPADKQIEIYSWTFSTGSGEYQEPDDERSGSLLNLPVQGGSSSSGSGLFVVDVNPANGASLLKVPQKASVTVGNVVIATKLSSAAYNDHVVEVVDGATAGAETVGVVGTTITITIEDGVSTAQQVVDAFNGEAAVNTDLEAITSSGATAQSVQSATKFSKGVDAIAVTITFNKDLNPASIADKIKVTTQPVYPSGPIEELSFSTSVSGNQLTITPLES